MKIRHGQTIWKFPYGKKKRVFLAPLGDFKYRVFYRRKKDNRLREYGEVRKTPKGYTFVSKVRFPNQPKVEKTKTLKSAIIGTIERTAYAAPTLFHRRRPAKRRWHY